MPNCEKYQELISRMIDFELSEAEAVELKAHVASCPDCRRLYAAFASVSDTIRNDLVEPPTALKKRVMAAVTDAPEKVISIRRRGRLIALAACLALVIAGSASLGLFSRKCAASLSAAGAPSDTMIEFGTDAAEKNQFVTSDQAANAAVDQAPKAFVQPAVAADAAYITCPGGNYETSDTDIISRLSALLSSSGESAAPNSGQSTTESYTVALPGQDSISVTIDGDKLMCQKSTGGEWFSASGSVSDFLALLGKMSPVS